MRVYDGCGNMMRASTFHNDRVEDGAEIEALGGPLFPCHGVWLGRNVG